MLHPSCSKLSTALGNESNPSSATRFWRIICDLFLFPLRLTGLFRPFWGLPFSFNPADVSGDKNQGSIHDMRWRQQLRNGMDYKVVVKRDAWFLLADDQRHAARFSCPISCRIILGMYGYAITSFRKLLWLSDSMIDRGKKLTNSIFAIWLEQKTRAYHTEALVSRNTSLVRPDEKTIGSESG